MLRRRQQLEDSKIRDTYSQAAGAKLLTVESVSLQVQRGPRRHLRVRPRSSLEQFRVR